MNCILHIGTEKTGTTLLQDWLYQNQKALSEQRVFLSNVLDINNNRRLVAYFQSELDDWTKRNNINSQQDKNVYFETFPDDFSEEIKRASSDHDLIIITSEHFHSRLRDKDEIKALQHYLDQLFDSVRVVCYFREQMQMAQSLYSTSLKGPYTATLEDFINTITPSSYYYNYKNIADNWSEAFGKQNCVFRIYDRRKFVDRDIRKDLLACLDKDLDVERLDFTKASSNESLSRGEAELYRITNSLVPFWKEGCGVVNSENVRIKNWISSIGMIKSGNIVDSRGALVSESFAPSNQEFSTEYFNGEEIFPGAQNSASNDDQKPSFTLDQVTELLGAFLRELLPDRAPASALHDCDADWLRDIALKQERQESLDLNDAIKLMELACKARPNGPFIKKKLVDYKEKFASSS